MSSEEGRKHPRLKQYLLLSEQSRKFVLKYERYRNDSLQIIETTSTESANDFRLLSTGIDIGNGSVVITISSSFPPRRGWSNGIGLGIQQNIRQSVRRYRIRQMFRQRVRLRQRIWQSVPRYRIGQMIRQSVWRYRIRQTIRPCRRYRIRHC